MTLWRIHWVAWTAGALIFGVLAAVILLYNSGAEPDVWWLGGVSVAITVIGIALTIAVPLVRWKRWRYDIDDREIYLQKGVFVRRRTLIPLVRVQNIDTQHGPIARWLGLAQVDVSTAAETHSIPALSEEEADRLRDRISALVQETGRDE